MSPRLREVLPYAVVLAAAAFLYWAAGRIDVETGGRIGPGVWPKAVIVFMAILCLFEIAKRLMAGRGTSTAGVLRGLERSPAGEPEAEASLPEHPRKLFGGIALVVAYVVGVSWLGFFVATALFLAVFPWVGGMRRPILSGVVGLAGAVALIVVFMRVAYISLPLGEGPFRVFSIALLRFIGVS